MIHLFAHGVFFFKDLITNNIKFFVVNFKYRFNIRLITVNFLSESFFLLSIRSFQITQLLLNINTNSAENFVILHYIFLTTHFTIKISWNLVAIFYFKWWMMLAVKLFRIEYKVFTDIQLLVRIIMLFEICFFANCLWITFIQSFPKSLGFSKVFSKSLFGLSILVTFVNLKRWWHFIFQRTIINISKYAIVDTMTKNLFFVSWVTDFRIGIFWSWGILTLH